MDAFSRPNKEDLVFGDSCNEGLEWDFCHRL